MEPLYKPFKEYRRLRDNKPALGLDPAYPKVTDGTVAAVVSKTPKRIVQQLPTGSVKSAKNDWLNIVAGFVYTNKILPYANHQFSLTQKCWAAIDKGLTLGSQPGYVPFLNHNGHFSTDLSLPFAEDVLLEPGKLSDKESNFIFMRSWYQPKDIEAIIDKEKRLKAKAKDRDEIYESGWNLSELAKIKNLTTSEANIANTNQDQNQRRARSGVEIVHAFQRGKGGKFYSFHADTGKIVRTRENKDPRGAIPIHYFYADTDLSNPLGRGYIELVASLQNLMDAEMQMYQYNRALMLNPPVLLHGVNKNRFKFAPNVAVETSVPDAFIRPVAIDTTAIANFPALYGLTKSQMLNMLSSPDTSISSDIGNPGFSKTPAGVKSQQANISVDDNFIRKQFESWFEDVSETMINLYFAERRGIDELQLDKATAEKLRKLTDFDQEMLSDDNKIRIDYDDETEKLQFQVDASTSNMKDDAAERDRLVELLDLSQKYPALSEILGKKGVTELVDRIIVKSGVEDPEKILPKQDDQEVGPDGQPVEQEQEAPQVTPEMVQQMVQQTVQEAMASSDGEFKKEQNNLKSRELDIKEQEASVRAMSLANKDASQHAQDTTIPPQPSDELTDDDMAFVDEIVSLGYTEEQAGQALAMLNHGLSIEEIISVLEGSDGWHFT